MYIFIYCSYFNPLNADVNPICHLLTLLGAHHILHVNRLRVNGICFVNVFVKHVLCSYILFVNLGRIKKIS